MLRVLTVFGLNTINHGQNNESPTYNALHLSFNFRYLDKKKEVLITLPFNLATKTIVSRLGHISMPIRRIAKQAKEKST